MSSIARDPADPANSTDRRRTLVLAVLFGAASVPWTYGFELAPSLPLWPSFIASAAVFAAGGGWSGLRDALVGLTLGATYAAATLWIAGGAGAGVLALSIAVGAFMFVASLHEAVPWTGYGPAAFLGFAAMFSVTAAGIGLGGAGLLPELTATLGSMAIGALIGRGVEWATDLQGT